MATEESLDHEELEERIISRRKLLALTAGVGAAGIIGLTPDGYQNLSVNIAELRRYIKQQNAAIQAMKNYYEKKDKQ